MIDTPDIHERIQLDFGDQAAEVIQIFEQAIANADHLNDDRILRCILFLAEKDIHKLKTNLAVAMIDPRDVMYWAEYSGQGELEQRVRDFSNPFHEAELP